MKKNYTFSLDERIVESIPWENKSAFVTVALCKTMIDILDSKEKQQKKNFKDLLDNGGFISHLRPKE
jgi:hypothetical protein